MSFTRRKRPLKRKRLGFNPAFFFVLRSLVDGQEVCFRNEGGSSWVGRCANGAANRVIRPHGAGVEVGQGVLRSTALLPKEPVSLVEELIVGPCTTLRLNDRSTLVGVDRRTAIADDGVVDKRDRLWCATDDKSLSHRRPTWNAMLQCSC
jgi:hypothetical protein